jgi:hypothetical protein
MRARLPSIENVGPDSPVRLNVAAALAFPDGSMTASGLRGLTTDLIGRLYRRTRSNRAKAALGS